MKIYKSQKEEIITKIKKGGVGILPTDTLYGLVGSALNKKAVQKIAKLKKRSQNKPFIILISKISDLKLFGVETVSDICLTLWPGPVSIVLQCPNLKKEMSYLKPLDKTLAFRCPNKKWLNVLLKQTGPLVAPSANPEGLPPAQSIEQAKKYFGNRVDFYFDGGTKNGKASKIIKIQNKKIEIIRK